MEGRGGRNCARGGVHKRAHPPPMHQHPRKLKPAAPSSSPSPTLSRMSSRKKALEPMRSAYLSVSWPRKGVSPFHSEGTPSCAPMVRMQCTMPGGRKGEGEQGRGGRGRRGGGAGTDRRLGSILFWVGWGRARGVGTPRRAQCAPCWAAAQPAHMQAQCVSVHTPRTLVLPGVVQLQARLGHVDGLQQARLHHAAQRAGHRLDGGADLQAGDGPGGEQTGCTAGRREAGGVLAGGQGRSRRPPRRRRRRTCPVGRGVAARAGRLGA